MYTGVKGVRGEEGRQEVGKVERCSFFKVIWKKWTERAKRLN